MSIIKTVMEMKVPTGYLHSPCNEMVFNHKAAITVCLIVFLAFLSSCAGLQIKSPEEKLLPRAEEFWAARVAGDSITCYKLEEVSKTGKQPVSAYFRRGGLFYKSAEITDTDINGDEAIVKVKISYTIPAMGSRNAFNTELVDSWKLIDGEWYHHQKNGIIGSGKKNNKGGG